MILSLMIPLLLLQSPSAQAAPYELIRCQNSIDDSSFLKIKVSRHRGIVATSEDSWTESDEGETFQKISQPFALDSFEKQRSFRGPEKSYQLELTTVDEVLSLSVSADLSIALYEVKQRDSLDVLSSIELTCQLEESELQTP